MKQYLQKMDGESFSNFVYRIAMNKEKLGLTWFDIRDNCNSEYNINCSESYYRKKFACGFFSPEEKPCSYGNSYNYVSYPKSDSDTNSDVDNEQELSLFHHLSAEEEKFKARKERQATRAMLSKMYAVDCYKEIADIVSKNMASNHEQLLHNCPRSEIKERDDHKAILCISDWHYGITINNFKNKFSPDICVKRVEKLWSETYNFLKLYNVNDLYIANLGDMIAGRIHTTLRLDSTEGIIKQTLEITEVLIDFIRLFLEKGIKVHYFWCLDNHSRIEPDKENSRKDENLVYVSTYIIKNAFKDNPNFELCNSDYGDDIIAFNCGGFRVAGCHGDLDRRTKVISNLSLFTGEKFDLVLSAHDHHIGEDENSSTVQECNGSLMGTDSYASDLRLSSIPSQKLIITSKDNVIYSVNTIRLEVYK